MATTPPEWRQAYPKFGTYLQDISRGNVRETSRFSSYGKMTTVGALSDALIQTQNGTGVIPVPTGVQMALASTSADDNASGSGVRTVLINYLDGNLDAQTETVTLNGTTPVNTVATDIRWVQSMVAVTFGSGFTAAGDISATWSGNTASRILTGDKISKSSFRRVPRDRVLYIASVFLGSSSGTAAAKVQVELATTFVGSVSQQATGVLYGVSGLEVQDNSFSLSVDIPFVAPAGEIVGFKCTTDKAATITAGYTGWLERP